MIFNCGGSPPFFAPFSGENMVLFTNISSTRLGESHEPCHCGNSLAISRTQNPTSTKTTQKILTKRWYPSQKKRWCALCRFFSFNMGFFKVFQTKVAAFPSWFFRENPGRLTGSSKVLYLEESAADDLTGGRCLKVNQSCTMLERIEIRG